uniref:Uncharacterized protein n=1 Tax=Glossina palpalis gambiensis TaxID=67801 RepID=A0A1B0BX89_9MUSC
MGPLAASTRLTLTASGLASRRRFYCAGAASAGVDGLPSFFCIDCGAASTNDVKSVSSMSFVFSVDVGGAPSARLMPTASGLASRRRFSCAGAVADASLLLLVCVLLIALTPALAYPGLLFRPVPGTGRIVAPLADAKTSRSPEDVGRGHNEIFH